MMKLYTNPFNSMPLAGVLLLTMLSVQSCKKNDVETPAEHPIANIMDADGDLVSLNPDTISTISKGLIAYWPLAGNTKDISGNGNDGIMHHTTLTADRQGNTGAALSFDGISSYISVKDTTSLQLVNTAFSLNAWVYMADHKNGRASDIINARSGVGDGWEWSIKGAEKVNESDPEGTLGFRGGASDATSKSDKAVAINGWHMVTNTYRRSDSTMKIYIDGVLDRTLLKVTPPAVVSAISPQLYIGRQNPIIGAGNYFKGSINDVRVYNRVITLNEIQYLYYEYPAPTAGLVGYWPLNRSTRGNDLSNIDRSSLPKNYNAGKVYHVQATADRLGNPVGAYSFNGKESSITFNNGAYDVTGSGDPSVRTTLNLWVKLADYNAPIIYFGPVGLVIDNNGKMDFTLQGAGTHVVSLQKWHMITIVYIGGGGGDTPFEGAFKIYLDNILDIEWSGNFDPTTGSTYTISSLGAYPYPGNNSLHGALCDFRIYNRELSNNELVNLHYGLN